MPLTPLVYMCAVLLVPIIPAYLLYRILPSETSVGGPFKGLNIRLTGAFAGYFLLVLVASGFAYSAVSPSKGDFEIWEIKGKVQPTGIVGVEIQPQDRAFVIDNSTGEFSIEVIVKPGRVRGQRDFPMLRFERRGYGKQEVKPRASDVVNLQEKEVTIKNEVMLPQLPNEPALPTWR